MTVSAFVRSLSLDGAGVRPFFTPADRAILALLADAMQAVGNNLNLAARSINSGRLVAASELTGHVSDARAIACAVSAELRSMSQRAGVARRGEVA